MYGILKVFTISLLFSLSFQVFASAVIKINSSEIRQFDGLNKYEIIGKNQFDQVILDCHSFLHGITFYDQGHPRYPEASYHFYLYEPECYEVGQFLYDSMKDEKIACIEISPRKNTYQLHWDSNCH